MLAIIAAGKAGLAASPQVLAAFGSAARQLSTQTTDLKKAFTELVPGQQVRSWRKFPSCRQSEPSALVSCTSR